MTPVETADPGDWKEPAEVSRPGRLTGTQVLGDWMGTSEEEGLRIKPEDLNSRTGPAGFENED